MLREDVKPIKFVLCVWGLFPLSSTDTEVHLRCLDQTPPPRELKVSDPKVRDLSLLQLQLVPTAVLYVKFLDESLNRELLSKLPSSCSTCFVDNNVQAPLVPSILATAIDLPLPLNTDENESHDKSQSTSGRTLGSSSARSSTLSRGVKSNNLGLNTAEAQKKLGKFFKGLGPSEASSFLMILRLILFRPTRDMRFVSSFAYLMLVCYVQTLLRHHSVLRCA